MKGSIKVQIAISSDEMFKFSRKSINQAYQISKTLIDAQKVNDIQLEFPEPKHTLNALVITWNVGNEEPPPVLKILQNRAQQFEIIVIGVQECEYTTAADHGTKEKMSCDYLWTGMIRKSVGSAYTIAMHQKLGEMKITMLARKQDQNRITRIQTGNVACGIGNVMANKGGIGIAFHWDDTSICFLNCHLAAHQGMVRERNENYHRIATKTNLGQGTLGFLHQYHYVIWMGDLNYRLSWGDQGKAKEPSAEDFKAINDLIDAGEYEELMKTDQLKEQIKNNVAWQGFKEGKYNFKPTFKVIRQEIVEYHPKRSPAYCDRILWKENKNTPIEQVFLKSDEATITSDHKPVYSHLKIPVCPIYENNLVDRGNFKIVFDMLRATDLRALDLGGKSDPYLLIICPSLFFKDGRTVTKSKTLNPIWGSIEVGLTANNPLMIKNQILAFKAMDYDGADHIDDLIGTQCLPLDAFVIVDKDGHLEEAPPVEFKLQLYYGKMPAGVVTGRIRIEPGGEDEASMMNDCVCCELL